MTSSICVATVASFVMSEVWSEGGSVRRYKLILSSPYKLLPTDTEQRCCR